MINLQRRIHNQPFNLIVFVEDLHIVVFQSQIGVTQPGDKEQEENVNLSETNCVKYFSLGGKKNLLHLMQTEHSSSSNMRVPINLTFYDQRSIHIT